MTFEPFKLEQYFARWEFSAPYVRCLPYAQPLVVPQFGHL